MKSFFTRLGYSFTPYFLRNFRTSLSLGQALVHYLLCWFIILCLSVVIAWGAAWYFSMPERVLPYLNRIPEFQLSFVDNVLVDTGFSDDPHVIHIAENLDITVSKKLSLSDLSNLSPGFLILKDGFAGIENQNSTHKIQTGKYAEMKIGTQKFDNARLNASLTELYPSLRFKVVAFGVPLLLLLASIFGFFWYLLISLFWAFIVWIVSRFVDKKLHFEHAWSFILYVFPLVIIIDTVLGFAGVSFFGFTTLLFVAVYFLNIRLQAGLSTDKN